MDEKSDPIDTSETPKCPNCGYINFVAKDEDDGDRYCMECSKAWDGDECTLQTDTDR